MQVSNTSSIKRSLQELTVPHPKPIFPNNRGGKNLWRDHTTKLRANKRYQDSFSVLVLYLAWEHSGSFLGRFSRHQGCVCGSAKEGGGDDPVVNLKLFWMKPLVPSQQLCVLLLLLLLSCRKTHPSLLSWAHLLQKSEQNNVVHMVIFLLVRDKK